MAKLSTYTMLQPGQPVPLTKVPVIWYAHLGKTFRSGTHASGVAPSIGAARRIAGTSPLSVVDAR